MGNIILAEDHKMGELEMRQVYASTMEELIKEGEPVVAMDADLMRAIGLLPYQNKYPDNILDCGIAEANMMGVAAGLSAEGFIPFSHSFGVFSSRRSMDQIFMSGAYAKLNVKVVGSDPGVCAGLNGGTHQAFEDVAVMRCIPEMTIIEPTDAVMVRDLTIQAAKTYGMFYIRMNRGKAETIYEEGSSFEIGKAVTLREGRDATIIAAGREVIEAVCAAELLEKEDIHVRVLDMFTLKPIDREAVITAAKETGVIVTAENHNIIGGLGSAVAEVLSENCPVPMGRVGVQDEFGEVGPADWLKERFRLTADDIAKKVRIVIERKG